MVDKKKYYALDEIGIIGTQEEISPKERKRIERITGDFIKAEKEKKTKTGKAKKRA